MPSSQWSQIRRAVCLFQGREPGRGGEDCLAKTPRRRSRPGLPGPSGTAASRAGGRRMSYSNAAPPPWARRPPWLRRAGSERRPGRTVTGSPGPRSPARAAPPPPRPEPAAPARDPRGSRANNTTGVPARPHAEGPRTAAPAPRASQRASSRRPRETAPRERAEEGGR